jgi:hypothetical protein
MEIIHVMGKIYDLGQSTLKAMIMKSLTRFKIKECKVKFIINLEP